MQIITKSVEETVEIGKKLGMNVAKGTTVCLTGDLGTGKTHFSKGFADGLGIKGTITSPTFTLINEYYDGRLPLFHFDVYRVHDEESVLDLGFEEYIYGNGVCLIEWADLIEGILPEQFIHVNIEKTDKEDERVITIKSVGGEIEWLKEMRN